MWKIVVIVIILTLLSLVWWNAINGNIAYLDTSCKPGTDPWIVNGGAYKCNKRGTSQSSGCMQSA